MSANQHGEWDAYQKLDELADLWVALNDLMDFEAFRDILEECCRPAAAELARGGRPPYDAVLMFKLLLVGCKCGLSDAKLQVLELESLRVVRFLGVWIGDAIRIEPPSPVTAHSWTRTPCWSFSRHSTPSSRTRLLGQRCTDDRCVVRAGADSAEYTG